MRDGLLSVEAFEAAEAAEAAQRAAGSARFIAWMAEQPDSMRALAGELFEMQTARKMEHGLDFWLERGKRGQIIYNAQCAGHHHQSEVSFEHALSLLVDANRTRAEDLEENYTRLLPTLDTDEAKTQILRTRDRIQASRNMLEMGPLPIEDAHAAAAIKVARATAQAIGRQVRAENPEMTGEERDALVLAAISGHEEAKRQRDIDKLEAQPVEEVVP